MVENKVMAIDVKQEARIKPEEMDALIGKPGSAPITSQEDMDSFVEEYKRQLEPRNGNNQLTEAQKDELLNGPRDHRAPRTDIPRPPSLYGDLKPKHHVSAIIPKGTPVGPRMASGRPFEALNPKLQRLLKK